MSHDLLILGASARAAACSALRGGLRPVCGDLFADDDLRQRCPSRRATVYPADLEAVASEWPVTPWMYTGALENYPELIERVARGRATWGNPADVVRHVRDPWRLRTALAAAGIAAPELRRHDAPPPADDGDWLCKRRRSGGGAHVVPWRGVLGAEATEEWYFQRRVDGITCGATFLSQGRRARLVGVAEQIIGASWCGVGGFRYCGSLGPTPLTAVERARLESLGDILTNEFELRGVWGVDLIRDAVGGYWPIEVNPRLPASAELYEFATGRSIVAEHVAACRGEERLPWETAGIARRDTTPWRGKAIVHARHDLRVDGEFNSWLHARNTAQEELAAADIPCVGEVVRAGQPLVTVFAAGPDRGATLRRLQERAAAVDEQAGSCRTIATARE